MENKIEKAATEKKIGKFLNLMVSGGERDFKEILPYIDPNSLAKESMGGINLIVNNYCPVSYKILDEMQFDEYYFVLMFFEGGQTLLVFKTNEEGYFIPSYTRASEGEVYVNVWYKVIEGFKYNG